jgi:hypothetical protein
LGTNATAERDPLAADPLINVAVGAPDVVGPDREDISIGANVEILDIERVVAGAGRIR